MSVKEFNVHQKYMTHVIQYIVWLFHKAQKSVLIQTDQFNNYKMWSLTKDCGSTCNNEDV